MFNIGPEELLLILVIALVFIGPKKLPDMARQIGKGLREFRNLSTNARRELMDNVSFDLNAEPSGLPPVQADTDETPVDVSSLPVWDGADSSLLPLHETAPPGSNGKKEDSPTPPGTFAEARGEATEAPEPPASTDHAEH